MKVEVDAKLAIVEIIRKIEVRFEQEPRTISILAEVGRFWKRFYQN